MVLPILAGASASPPSSSESPRSGLVTYSRHSAGAPTGKDLTKRGVARFREKISTCPRESASLLPTYAGNERGEEA